MLISYSVRVGFTQVNKDYEEILIVPSSVMMSQSVSRYSIRAAIGSTASGLTLFAKVLAIA